MPDEPLWPSQGVGLATFYNVKSPAYGAKGDGVTNDQAAVQAALDTASAAGGGAVYVPAGTYNLGQHPTITNTCLNLPSNVVLIGDGDGTILRPQAAISSTVAYVIATQAGTYGYGVFSLRLDGNSVTTITGIGYYDSTYHGPYSFAYNTGTIYSGQFPRIARVTISNFLGSGGGHGTGIFLSSVAGVYVSDCYIYRCVGGGLLDQGSDNVFENVIVGGSTASSGMKLGPSSKATNCKIFASGTSSIGAFVLSGNSQGAQAANCEVQECIGIGVQFSGNENRWVGGMVNCLTAAVSFSSGASYNVFEGSINTQTLGSGTYTPSTAVAFVGTNTGNTARVRSSFSPATWISGTADGNLVQFNDMGTGTPQVIAFAAIVTADAYAGDTVIVGPLTANITVANPTNGHKGCRLVYILPQDATGGRTVTLGAAFKTAFASGASGGTANQTLTLEVVYDGTNWREVGHSIA